MRGRVSIGGTSTYTAAILSDSPIIRTGLRALVEESGGMVGWEGLASRRAVAELTSRRCDVAVLDVGTVSFAEGISICTTAAVTPSFPPLIAVERSMQEPTKFFPLLPAHGADVPTDPPCFETLWAALDAVSAGGEEALGGGNHARRRSVIPSRQLVPVGSLTDTDRQILDLLGRGLRDREIADLLVFSPSTIKHRIESLQRELHLRTRFQLGAWAEAYGLAHLPLEVDRANNR